MVPSVMPRIKFKALTEILILHLNTAISSEENFKVEYSSIVQVRLIENGQEERINT